MPTFHQLTKNSRKPRRYKNKRIALNNCSQKRATCLKVHVITPRKPNSGLRKISRVIFTSNFKRVNTYIPGIGYNTLQKHFSVLVRGMQIKDRSHKIMKGNFNLKALVDHHHACSKYGFHTKKTLNGLPLGILLSQNFYFFSFDLEYQIMNFMITNDIIFDDFFRKCVLLSILFLLVIIN
jgi:small subunit ribosomal protein S12